MQKGDLRDSAHAVVVAQPGKFTTTPPVAGKDIDALNAGRLAVYPAGTELWRWPAACRAVRASGREITRGTEGAIMSVY